MNRRQFLGLALSAAVAPALAGNRNNPPRILSLRHLHTDEKIQVAYRIGDRYQRDALHKLNEFLRDYRTGETAMMDPRLFDLLFDISQGLGSDAGAFEILSGYRSPTTNAELCKSSGRVARHSLHMSGQAADIRLASTATRRVRDAAIALSRGGVGFYPRSDFVHVDTGEVRRWGA